MILNYSLICLLNFPQASENLRRVCDPCSDRRYQLHTLSLYICLLLIVQCQKKINANYWHFTPLDVILIFNPSINSLLLFMLLKELLDIKVSCSVNACNLRCHEMAA